MNRINTSAFAKLYPFRSNWLEIDGLKYHYLDEGPKSDSALVMVHGNPTWSFYYRNLILTLRKKYRVIVPDHMGCGFSDKPQDYTYNLKTHVDNLTHLLNHLSLTKITFVLHDWGGAIGMGYGVKNPEKMDRFIILNTAAFFVPQLPWRIKICRVPVLGQFLVQGLNGFSLAALLFAVSRHKKFTRDIKNGYLMPYNSWNARIAVHQFVKDIPMHPRHPTRKTIDEIDQGLKQFKSHPMIIFWGEDDFCFTVKDFVPQWQKRFPSANVNLIPNAGHYVLEDAFEEIYPQINEFLGNN